jgi:hypothetical protein
MCEDKMRKITIIIEDDMLGSVYQQPYKRIMNIYADSIEQAFTKLMDIHDSPFLIKNEYAANRIVHIYNEGKDNQKVELVKDKPAEAKNSDLDPMYGPSPIENNLDKYWKGLAEKQKGFPEKTKIENKDDCPF